MAYLGCRVVLPRGRAQGRRTRRGWQRWLRCRDAWCRVLAGIFALPRVAVIAAMLGAASRISLGFMAVAIACGTIMFAVSELGDCPATMQQLCCLDEVLKKLQKDAMAAAPDLALSGAPMQVDMDNVRLIAEVCLAQGEDGNAKLQAVGQALQQHASRDACGRMETSYRRVEACCRALQPGTSDPRPRTRSLPVPSSGRWHTPSSRCLPTHRGRRGKRSAVRSKATSSSLCTQTNWARCPF